MTETSSSPEGVPPEPPAPVGDHSKVIRHEGGFAWADVPIEAYKATSETWRGITRRELVGERGESTSFHVRYFEIAPGGHSTLEKHGHQHVVVVLRGRGEARFGPYLHRVSFGDVIYVAPDDPHRFSNPEDAEEPFGFLCIVDAERDAPCEVDGLGACWICE